MKNVLFENFKRYYPATASKCEECREEAPGELFARLSDGVCVIYDDLYQTVRRLPSDSNSMTEDECRSEFGKRLNRIMIRKGMTQKELAEETGLQQSQISNYMTGKVTPSFYNADKIAKALGCSTDVFRYLD